MPVETRSSFNINKLAIKNKQIIKENICRIDQVCGVCQDDLYSSCVYHMPCGHIFHKDCFEKQIQTKKAWSSKCAMCRMDLKNKILLNKDLFNFLPLQPLSYEIIPDFEIENQEDYWNFAQNIITWYNDYDLALTEEYSSISTSSSLPDLVEDLTEDEVNLLLNENLLINNEIITINDDDDDQVNN